MQLIIANHSDMEKDLISIIIPIYKVEKYLSKCVDSVVNQTYRNLEIFLVDDGSPDRCGEMCDEYAKVDPRVKVIHKKNGGLSDARNVAIDVATGDYILFVDSDDWIELNTCERLINLVHEVDADVIVFGVNKVNPSGKNLGKICSDESKYIGISDGIGFLITYGRGVGNYACNKFYRSSVFCGVRYPVGKLYEDNGTTYKLFHQAKNIYLCNQCFYNYLLRDDSISAVWYSPRGIKARLSMWIERLEFLKEHYPEHVDAQIAQIVGEMFIGLVKMEKEPDYAEFKKQVEAFVKKYNPDFKELKKYNRRLWLYYYCKPLFNPYVRLFCNR